MWNAAAKVVSDTGKRLGEESRPSKDFIVKSLRKTVTALSELDQCPSLRPSISPLSACLVKHRLLQHKDKDVRLLVAICVSEIIRVLAPEPPFSDKILRDIFKLLVCVFADLSDRESPYFSRRVKILETVAKLKFCIQMLDIGCEDLIVEMFSIFFNVVREDDQPSLVDGILSIVTLILNEEVSQPLLDVIFQSLLKKGEGAPPACHCLAVSVIKSCAQELEADICKFLSYCISDKDAVETDLKDSYHKIIYEIFQYVPQMLRGVIPSLLQELLADQVDVRIKAVNLIGKFLALPGCHFTQEYPHLFSEFLKRFSDKSAEVRLSALQCTRECYLADPCGANSLDLLAALEGRLLDIDDRVRTKAVVIACDIAKSTLKYVPVDLISRASERLRDKKASVRKAALQKLLEVYRNYCSMCSAANAAITDQFEQIPCRILMLCYEKDCREFRLQNLEVVFAEDLFPTSLSVVERTKHWYHMFSLFTPAHVKALTSILSQKQRFQKEMRCYLVLRMKEKASGLEDLQNKVRACFKKMSTSFPDNCKAEECFLKLDQLKDNSIIDALKQLMDDVESTNIPKVRDELRKKIGDKHPLFDFVCFVFAKCSHNIFSSDHVRCILDSMCSTHLEADSINLLVVILTIFPFFLRGSEKLLQELLLENIVNEKLIQILAKAGPYISINLSDIYPFLERVCLEGTRAEAKLAVSAIAALNSFPAHDIFQKLWKKLVDSLHGGKNIPTVLQSLGCVAQHSVLTFQKQDHTIKQHISEHIFKVSEPDDPGLYDGTSDCSSSCKEKIYALKALVKSVLPHEGNHAKYQINDLLEILSNMLRKGEVFDDTVSREVDKTFIRLAAASSVLRLSRRWDFHIYPQIFHSTVLIAKMSSASARRTFLDKLNKLLRERSIPSRYACAFALAASDSNKELQDDPLKRMGEIVRHRIREAQIQQASLKQGNSVADTDHPVYIVVYLIHVLAHDSCFPPDNCVDEEKYADLFRPLLFTLRILVNAAEKFEDLISYLYLILRAIKKAEDAVDPHKTRRLGLFSDIGILILDNLTKGKGSAVHAFKKVFLPSSIYRYVTNTSEGSLKCLPFFGHGFLTKIVDRLLNLSLEGSSAVNSVNKGTVTLALRKEINVSRNGKKTEGKNPLKCGNVNHKPAAQQRNAKGDHGQIVSNHTSGLIELRSRDALIIEEEGASISGNLNPIHEKEQILSSCGSVTAKASVMETQDLVQNIDPSSSVSWSEPDGTRKSSDITEEHNGNCRAHLIDLCSTKATMKKSEMLPLIVVSSEDGDRSYGEQFSLSSPEESLEMLKGETAQLDKTLAKMGNENNFPAKRKRVPTTSADPPLSEVVDVNNDIIARRTRRWKV